MRFVGSVTFVIHVVVEKVFWSSVFVIRMADRKQSYSCLQDKYEVRGRERKRPFRFPRLLVRREVHDRKHDV